MTGAFRYEHLHRYALCLGLVADRDVLDVSCGQGYGSALLASKARHVTGVDMDPRAIERARRTYYRGNVRYLVGDCAAIPLADDSVDVVVSFDTLERLEERDTMLSEVRRVLRPGGRLVISAPNPAGDESASDDDAFAPQVLYYDDFLRLLERHFACVRVHGQRIAAASFIYPLTERLNGALASYGANGGDTYDGLPSLDRPVHFVAVCADDERALPDIDSLFVDAHDDLLGALRDEHERALQQIALQRKALLGLTGASDEIDGDFPLTERELPATGIYALPETSGLANELADLRRRAVELTTERETREQAEARMRAMEAAWAEERARLVEEAATLGESCVRLESERDAFAAQRDAVLAERDALAAEREGFAAELDGLASARDALAAERDSLMLQCSNLHAGRDAVIAAGKSFQDARDAVIADRDAIAAHRDALAADRDSIIEHRDALAAHCAALEAACDALRAAYEAVEAERDAVTADRDAGVKHREALEADRDSQHAAREALMRRCAALESELAAVVANRDSLREERDAFAVNRDALRDERDALASDRANAVAERDAAVAAQTDFAAQVDSLAREVETLVHERDYLFESRERAAQQHEEMRAERDAAISGHRALQVERDELAARVAAAERERGETDADRARLQRRLDAAVRDTQTLRGRFDGASAEISALRGRVATLADASRRLSDLIAVYEAQGIAAREERAECERAGDRERAEREAVLDTVLTSRSWRLTRPLRLLVNGLRGTRDRR